MTRLAALLVAFLVGAFLGPRLRPLAARFAPA